MINKAIKSTVAAFVILLYAGISTSQEESVYVSSNQSLVKQIELFEGKVLADLNEKEIEWYERFKQGIMFFDGWNEISKEILETFPEDVEDDKKGLIKRLGVKIGSEWCRDNAVRKIDTQKLKEWGEKIKVAVDNGPEDTEKILKEIESEVDQLLEHSNRLSLFTSQS